MRTEFEGVELYGDIQGVEAAGNSFDKTFSGIWGWTSDEGDTHFVVSAELFERDKLNVKYGNHLDENSEYLAPVFSIINSTVAASPQFGANLNAPYYRADITAQNVAEGSSPGSAVTYADPLCETMQGTSGIPFQVGRLRENRGERSGTCWEDVTRFNFLARSLSVLGC